MKYILPFARKGINAIMGSVFGGNIMPPGFIFSQTLLGTPLFSMVPTGGSITLQGGVQYVYFAQTDTTGYYTTGAILPSTTTTIAGSMQGGPFAGVGGVNPGDWSGASYTGGVSYTGNNPITGQAGAYGEGYIGANLDSNGKPIIGAGGGVGVGTTPGINGYAGMQNAAPIDESNSLGNRSVGFVTWGSCLPLSLLEKRKGDIQDFLWRQSS